MRSNYYRMGHLVCGTDIPRCTTLVGGGTRGEERDEEEARVNTLAKGTRDLTRERERRSSCRSFTTRTRTCARGIRRLNIICGPYRSLPPRERRRTSRWKRGPLFAVFFASTFYCHSDVWTRRRPLSAVLLVERGEDFLRIVLGNGRRDWAFFEVFLLLKIRRKIRRLSE